MNLPYTLLGSEVYREYTCQVTLFSEICEISVDTSPS